MRAYDLYLFDFDNTLFDSSASMERMLSAGMEAVGLAYDHSMFPQFAGMTLTEICGSLPEGRDGGAFREAFEAVADSFTYRSAVPFPETFEVLEALKRRNRRVGIASGKRTFKIIELLESYGMDRFTDCIVGYDDTDRHKPDPQPLELALSRMGSDGKGALYIGDSMNDYLAAHACGMDVAIVHRDNGLCMDGVPADHAIGSLKDLLEGWE